MLFSDSGFVVLQGSSYWTDLFVRHFLFQAEHCIDGDDLLFFVRKKHVKGSPRYLPKYEVQYFFINVSLIPQIVNHVKLFHNFAVAYRGIFLNLEKK